MPNSSNQMSLLAGSQLDSQSFLKRVSLIDTVSKLDGLMPSAVTYKWPLLVSNNRKSPPTSWLAAQSLFHYQHSTTINPDNETFYYWELGPKNIYTWWTFFLNSELRLTRARMKVKKVHWICAWKSSLMSHSTALILWEWANNQLGFSRFSTHIVRQMGVNLGEEKNG